MLEEHRMKHQVLEWIDVVGQSIGHVTNRVVLPKIDDDVFFVLIFAFELRYWCYSLFDDDDYVRHRHQLIFLRRVIFDILRMIMVDENVEYVVELDR